MPTERSNNFKTFTNGDGSTYIVSTNPITGKTSRSNNFKTFKNGDGSIYIISQNPYPENRDSLHNEEIQRKMREFYEKIRS
jgi:hypothetical protein